MIVSMSLDALRTLGSTATVSDLLETLEAYAENGASIVESTIRNSYWAIGQCSKEHIQKLLASSRKGARRAYHCHKYREMTEYDLLSHFLEGQLDLAAIEGVPTA